MLFILGTPSSLTQARTDKVPTSSKVEQFPQPLPPLENLSGNSRSKGLVQVPPRRQPVLLPSPTRLKSTQASVHTILNPPPLLNPSSYLTLPIFISNVVSLISIQSVSPGPPGRVV